MRYSAESIVEDVRTALDENMKGAALGGLGDVDTLSLDELIKSKVNDAALSVIMSAPVRKLSDVAILLSGGIVISESERHKVTMRLPFNFVRLMRFKMKSWRMAVFDALSSDSPQYRQAHSEYNVYGTVERPAVFLVPSPSGDVMQLEAFCAGSTDDTLDGCLYVERPWWKYPNGLDGDESNPEMEIGVLLYRPTIYYAAYLTALAIKDGDAASALLATAKEMLES